MWNQELVVTLLQYALPGFNVHSWIWLLCILFVFLFRAMRLKLEKKKKESITTGPWLKEGESIFYIF